MVPISGYSKIPDSKIDRWSKQYVELYRNSAILPNLAVKLGIAKKEKIEKWPARLKKKALVSIEYFPKINLFKFGDRSKVKIIDLDKKVFEVDGKEMIFPKDFLSTAKKNKSAYSRPLNDFLGIFPRAMAQSPQSSSSFLNGCQRMSLGEEVYSVLYDFAVFRETLNVYPLVFYMAKMADAYTPVYSDSCEEQITHINRLLRENNAAVDSVRCQENIIGIDTGSIQFTHDIYRGSTAIGPWLVEHSAIYGDSYKAYANPFGMVVVECNEGSEGLNSVRSTLDPYLPALNYMARKSFCYKCTDSTSIGSIQNLPQPTTPPSSNR